jgi:hypothetical protein
MNPEKEEDKVGRFTGEVMNGWAIRAMRRTERITGRARIENIVYKLW